MSCKDCPYGKEDYERRVEADQILYGNNEFMDQEEQIWCDKVGGKVCLLGYCEDAFDNVTKERERIDYDRKEKRRKRLKKTVFYKKKLERLYHEAQGYPAPVRYIDERWYKWHTVQLEKPYYKREWRGNRKGNAYQYHKKAASKAVRRYNKGISKGGNYKKLYDYWWNVN